MAKTKGPLLSQEAHGSLGKVLTYSRRKSGQQTRKINQPTGLPSAKQYGYRRLVAMIIIQWQNMTGGERATWAAAAAASGKHISTYHYFLHEALLSPYLHHGLCGYWHMNEIVAGQVLDISGNNHHGSLEPTFPTNVPRLTASMEKKVSKGLLFNGTNQYVDPGSGGALNITTGKLTVEAIVSTTAGAPVDQICTKDYGGADRAWQFRKRAGKLELVIFADAVKTTIGVTPITDGVLRLAGATYDGAAAQKVFVNGQEDKSLGNSGPMKTSRRQVFIGRSETGDPGWWPGIIDEVFLYNRDLSPAEMLARYNWLIS